MFLAISGTIVLLYQLLVRPWEPMSVGMQNLASGLHVLEAGCLIDLVVHPLSEYCTVLISNWLAPRVCIRQQ